MYLSKQYNNWITVGEVINLIRQPVVTYTDNIIKEWHAKLAEKLISFQRCTYPGNCLTSKKPSDLCHSCNGWYENLASLHRNPNKFQIKWRQNCDTSKWLDDAWEVAKFFMFTLGDNKNTVKDAESTDLSSLLNVLEWTEDAAFGGSRRVDLNLVKELRSKVRNAWAHAPKQEMTDTDSNNAFKIAIDFLIDLDKVFSSTEIKECMTKIQHLQDNGLTSVVEAELKALLILRKELSGDVSQMKQEIKNLKQDQESDRKRIQKNEKQLRNLKDSTEECCVRMEHVSKEFQNWRGQLDNLFKNFNLEMASFRKEIKEDISYLPDKSSQFIGRDTEVKKSVTYLVEEDSGIVSIVGGPGFGKSSTAVEIAHHLHNQRHIPVFFADLRGASTVSEVNVRLCHAMGVHQMEPKSSLTFFLREMMEKCVLVMDNVEQLLEEKTVDDFIGLLRLLRMQSHQHLQILLTSTNDVFPTGIESKTISLKPLDRNSSKQLVRMYYPEKELDDHYLDKLADLCGDVPLALRLAASRLQDVRDPEQLLKWLREDPLEVLKSPLEKVKKSIEMSFNRLQEQEQNSFVRLSVFDGSFDFEAAQEVTGLEGVQLQNFLTNLVHRSLMERSCNRYSVHPLIRSFLMKCENNGEFDKGRRLSQEKMVRCFLKVCQDLTAMYWSKDGFNDARRLLKDDSHNVEKTLQLCRESLREDPNQEIVESLRRSEIYQSSTRFFYHFVLHVLSQSVVSSFLEVCAEVARQYEDAAVEVLLKCLTAHIVGRTCGWKSEEFAERMKGAETTFLENQKALKQQSRKLEAYSYYWYSQYLSYKESLTSDHIFEQAQIYLKKYLELKENEGQNHLEEVDIGVTLMQLGRINRSPGKESTAAECYEKALKCFETSLGDHDVKLCCHKELGDSHFEQGNHEKAVEFYKDAMEVHRKIGASNANMMFRKHESLDILK